MTLEDAVRLACFGACAAPDSYSSRFGVSPSRILEHLRQLGRHKLVITAKWVDRIHPDDLALICACVDGRSGAWEALSEKYEVGLVAAAGLHLPREQAVITVRRMFAQMRADLDGPPAKASDPRRYAGETSLQSWLVERLMTRVSLASAIASTRRRSRDPERRVRLALDRIGVSRRLLKECQRRDQAELTGS